MGFECYGGRRVHLAPRPPGRMKGRDSMAQTRTLLAAVAALMALSLAACTPNKGEKPVTDLALPAPAPTPTLAGNYLAGRHAQAVHDLGTASDYLNSALGLDPDDPDLIKRTFVLMATEGRMAEAAPLALRVIAANPRDTIANLTRAADGIKNGRFAQTNELLVKLPENGINAFMVPLLRAWALVGLKRYDDALAALKPMGERKGFKALSNLHGALINEIADRTEDAERLYLAAAKVQKSASLRLTELMGGFYERTGQPDKAKVLYDAYAEARPESRLLVSAMARLSSGKVPARDVDSPAGGAAEALFDVASSLRQQNAQETALMFGRLALWLRPDFPVTQILVAGILESNGRLESANAIYAGIDRKSSFAWSARLRIGRNLDNLGQTEDALRHFTAMAEENPSHPDPLIELGDVLRGHDQFAEAVTAYDQAVERIGTLARHHWGLLYARGISLERSGEWQRAEADFLKALEFEPNQPYVLNYLGYSWVDKGMNLDRAQKMIRKAVELRPNDGYIVDSLGWVLYRLGDYDAAARELERAVELRAEDPIINDHLGDAYWRVGRQLEARFQWRRALSLDPEKDMIDGIRAKVENGPPAEATRSPR